MASPPSLGFAVIGCGWLGTAITNGILDASAQDSATRRVSRVTATVATAASQQRVVSETSKHQQKISVHLSSDNLEAIQAADVVIIATKPKFRELVFNAPGVREALRGKLLLSIMAGVSTSALHKLANGRAEHLETDCAVVRIMPNMAARIKQATSLGAFIPGAFSPDHQALTKWVFESVGSLKFVDESTFDISSVIVGCSGSLVMLAVDGLLDAAVAEGLKRSDAQEYAVSSAIGMLSLLTRENGGHPSVTRENIASPGGNSIRALLELEDRGVRSAYCAAIMKASEKSRALSSQ